MPTSPEKTGSGVISYTILVEGKEINNTYLVSNITVRHNANRISTANFTLRLMAFERTGKTFSISESDEFIPGKKIEIKVGYDQKNDCIFKGIISSHNVYVKSRSFIELEIGCHDEAIKMTNSGQTRLFEEKSDSEIIQSIIKEHNLATKVTSTTIKYPIMIQQQATDWDFILTRAQANGFLVSTENGTLKVEEPAKSSANTSLILTYDEDVYEFQGRMNAAYQIPDIKISSWDDAKFKKKESQSKEPDLVQPGNFKGKDFATKLAFKPATLQSTTPLAAKELKAWGEASLLKSRLAMFRGTVKFKGNALPKVNELVELANFGKRFNGKTLVTGVYHELSGGAWTTQLTFGLSPEWFYQRVPISAPPAGGLLPAVQGLQIALVKKIDGDPDTAFRVQVDLQNNTDSDSDDKQEVWARMIQSYATNGAGAFFYPEIGDEVLIGFINDDPRFPVILGHLYSKKRKPAYTPDEKNSIKALVSKKKIKIEMNDEDKTLHLETPEQQSIFLSDKDKSIEIKDSNGNSIKLSSDGITLDSAKNIVLKAKQDIILDANSKIHGKAKADISLDGLNIKAKAKVALEASGNASAKLSASGQLTIQGAMVMIN